MTDLLLAYAALGAAAGLMALAGILWCLSTRRNPARRRMLRVFDEAELPLWLVSLLLAIVVLAMALKVAALWPLYARRMLGRWW